MSEEPNSETRAAATTVGRGTRRTTRPRTAARATTTRRRRRQGGPELVETLNGMVEQLIKENRKLKRQIDKLAQSGTAVTSQAVERSLRTIQRRVQRALDAPQPRRRRARTTTSARGAARTTRTRRASSRASSAGST